MKIYEDNSEFPENSDYSVVNWESPQHWEGMFSHDSIPRLSFNRKAVSLNPCQETVVHDLSLTEGRLWNQLDDEEIQIYFDLLRKLSGSRGVVRCLEIPSTNATCLDRLIEKGYQFPEIIVRLERESKVSQVPVTQVVKDFAGSDFYLQGVYHSSRENELKEIQEFVGECFHENKVPVVRLLDVSRGAFDSYLFGVAKKLKSMAENADLPVRLRLVDSLGLFSGHPQAAYPRGLPRLLDHLLNEIGYPGEWLIVEPANDTAQAAACLQAAWLYGVDAVGATFGGRGPRAGLASIESALAEIASIRQDAPRLNLSLVRDIENLITASGAIKPLVSHTPYLGSEVFRPRTHEVAEIDSLANAYDPALIWGASQARVLTPRSSRHDVVEWLRSVLGQGIMISPEHPGVVKLTEWVKSRVEVTLSDKELLRQARRHLPGFFVMEGPVE